MGTKDESSSPIGTRSGEYDAEAVSTTASSSKGWASWFGGPDTTVGPRICPGPNDGSEDSSQDILLKQIENEADARIKYRTCSWQKTAALLFSEYICLAMMSFPWSYSVLGLVPGIILTVVQAGLVLYTSLVLWQFCLRHPEVRDVTDVGQMLFWGKKWAWYATAVIFLLNNTFIQGLHILTGAKYINTMIGGETSAVSCQTVSFGIIVMLISWICSLPRTFEKLANIATASALFTFISVFLATVFAGVQSHPAGYGTIATTEPIVTAIPLAGTTFVAGLNAFLNISYTFIGQITLPSFIAEMKDPKDFPKALWLCTILEIILFCIVGAVIYAFTGNQYMTTPAFGSLQPIYKKVAFSFMIPTLIFLGVLYASVSARFLFTLIFGEHSHHKKENTVKGWTSWSLILLALWIAAFIIANVIPFFSSLLSLMSSLFDSFFGFIFWGVAYFRMREADSAVTLVKERSLRGYLEGALNIVIILTGFFFLTVGTYASVEQIRSEFQQGSLSQVFQCASNGI